MCHWILFLAGWPVKQTNQSRGDMVDLLWPLTSLFYFQPGVIFMAILDGEFWKLLHFNVLYLLYLVILQLKSMSQGQMWSQIPAEVNLGTPDIMASTRAPLHLTDLLFISVWPLSHCTEIALPPRLTRVNMTPWRGCCGILSPVDCRWPGSSVSAQHTCTSVMSTTAAGNLKMPKCWAKVGPPVLENPSYSVKALLESLHHFQLGCHPS